MAQRGDGQSMVNGTFPRVIFDAESNEFIAVSLGFEHKKLLYTTCIKMIKNKDTLQIYTTYNYLTLFY